jgi:hypothetical protein
MQRQAIAEIERNRPQFVVFVSNPKSFQPVEGVDRRIFEWWPEYWRTNLDLVMRLDTKQGQELSESDFESRRPGGFIFVLQRKE